MRELTEGQLYKLEPAPKGAQPNPLPRTIVYHIKGLEDLASRRPKKAKLETQAAVERATAADVGTGIPKPDKRKPKATADAEAAAIPAGFDA
jgi:hypothetical protein